ncbi:MAG: inositol monophosphatase [Nitrospinaceae bacterium]|nr:inositol monophosphatase [Nitrospinaceae bacterium]NIR56126.1 inositol monophosphatase [Nitrospinaceae bacterium]NIS86574.1 inositol monophosphatase [Nitrospinaceae bacterium]NIT83408.1 inositol monophosphatase [Nitrospinaceae bacterium]NIU45618.1 inositol monophosphatase [Nitrospinaceae bacterium]
MSDALTVAVEAARAAGRIQKERADRVGEIQYKGEINVVTEVDLLCEKEVIGRIKKQFPTHAFLAEESGVTEGDADHMWIIDPLDGTVNYAHGYPCYCVSIGYQRKGEVVVGVVYNPCLDELFVAERGKGATLNEKPIAVSATTELKKSLLATGFAYDINEASDNNLDHFQNFIKACQALRRPGSAAMDLCYTAMGRFEGFWELKLHPWDYAAGWLMIEEAGGKVTRFDGSPFQMGDRSVLSSNGHIHQAMVDVLKKASL